MCSNQKKPYALQVSSGSKPEVTPRESPVKDYSLASLSLIISPPDSLHGSLLEDTAERSVGSLRGSLRSYARGASSLSARPV